MTNVLKFPTKKAPKFTSASTGEVFEDANGKEWKVTWCNDAKVEMTSTELCKIIQAPFGHPAWEGFRRKHG
jgi:hypothetical protein